MIPEVKSVVSKLYNKSVSFSFTELILGEQIPLALEYHQWDQYYAQLRTRKPYRYWIAQRLFKTIKRVILWPYRTILGIRAYIHNRWISKTHYLKTGLTPGYYYEFDDRILYGLFNELVEFVEIQLAHISLHNDTKKYQFKDGRCVAAAYDYFAWADSLTEEWDLPLKQSMQTVQELYEWWTISRPQRIESHEITPATHGNDFLNIRISNDYDYYQEDTQQIIRLIKIRQNLWT